MPDRINVLVTDDEADVRRGVSLWLNAAGFDTFTANDGAEAVCAAREKHPGAIVLDVRMPRVNGMQALEALQKCPETKSIPVVMLSASLVDQQRALEAGAKFFLRKPYSGKELVCALRSVTQDSV